EQDFHDVAIPHRTVVFFRGGAVRLAPARLLTADREIEAAVLPAGFHRRAEGGRASGLQLAQAADRGAGTLLPVFVIELAVEHEAAGVRDDAQRRNRAALLPKLPALVAQAVEKVVRERDAPGLDGTGRGFLLRGREEREGGV